MKEQDRPEEIAASNERSLSTLSRAINLSNGNFALILVRCNYEVCSSKMWQRLQELTESPLSQLVLQKSIKTLFGSILAAIIDEQTSALVVFGLESVTALDQVLILTNRVRDEFRKSLTFPLVLWITDEVLQKLARFAPDIKSWAATSIKFELATEQLLALWQQTADELFAAILDSDMGEFLPNHILNLAPSCRRRQELEAALRDLHTRDVSLDPALVATWQFILGRDAFSDNQIDVALQQYQQSLNFWQQALRSRDRELGTRKEEETGEGASISFLRPSLYLERVGILFHHIGLCYCRQAELQPAESFTKWEQARESFSAAIEVFATAAHSDLVAQLTIQLGEVLQHLKSWTDLQALALQSLEQPQIQNSPVRLAQAYGFLAVVAHTQSNWQVAKDLALTAICTLEQSQLPQQTIEDSLTLRYQGLYLLVLAKAQRQMGEVSAAVTTLEQAIKLETLQPNSLQQKPLLYIEILEELRSLYFEQHQYLQAFELKQERRSIEQHFGFSTFVGAAPLQPLGQGRGSRISTHDLRHSQASLEIVAAGRLLDVNCLIERLSRNDHRLTVIHGSSGVGKSSLINAGLVPALEARIIGAREAVPIVQTVYRDWIGELERLLTEALASWQVGRLQVESSIQHSNLPIGFSSEVQLSIPQKLQTILELLRLASERNLLTVLIFDQFEEFFFCLHQSGSTASVL